MQFKTHIAFAFLVSLFLIDFLRIKDQILFLIIVLFFSILPDIDEYSSKISKKLRPVSFIINLLFKHRGLFHSIIIPLLISIILFSINQNTIAIAAALGYVSHLILDALSISGIAPLWPINKKIRGFIKVNSLWDNLLFYILIIIIIYKLI